ncbi:hypothetical protein D3C84_375880 [compost metagenome]
MGVHWQRYYWIHNYRHQVKRQTGISVSVYSGYLPGFTGFGGDGIVFRSSVAGHEF